MVERVQHHSAAALILPERGVYIALVGLYTDSYPHEPYRGNYNFLGGNALGNYSPEGLFKREFTEETLGKPGDEDLETPGEIIGADELDEEYVPPEINKYAPRELRERLRNAVMETLQPMLII